MTDANGSTGLDCAQAANHDNDADWNVVGSSFSEDTTANGREMINICDQAGLCLGNTWKNAELTVFTPMCPSSHRIDFIAFGQERFDTAEIETRYEWVSSSVHRVTVYRCVSDSHLRDVGDETKTETHLAPVESCCSALGDERRIALCCVS